MLNLDENTKNLPLKTLIKKKSSSSWIKYAASKFFKARLCELNVWITNSDGLTKFSTSFKLAGLQKKVAHSSSNAYAL